MEDGSSYGNSVDLPECHRLLLTSADLNALSALLEDGCNKRSTGVETSVLDEYLDAIFCQILQFDRN